MSGLDLAGKNFEELLALFFLEMAEDDDYYDQIGALLAAKHGRYFSEIMGGFSDKRLRAAIFGFGVTGESEWGELVSRYVPHPNDLIMAEAIDAMRRLGCGASDHISLYACHASPYVRGAVLRLVKQLMPNERVKFLIHALGDPHPFVRQGALDELDGMATTAEMKAIEPLLNDPDAGVREIAAHVLEGIEK